MANLNFKFVIQPSKALVNTPHGDWLNLRSLRSKLCLSPFPELDAVRTAIRRGNPLGGEQRQQGIAKRLGLESTLRPRGRPSKSQVQAEK
jgi:hypothetical protein